MAQQLNYAAPKSYTQVTQEPHKLFHSRGVLNGWKGDRLFRIYVKDGRLYFIKVGGSRNQQAAMGAQLGLLGILLGYWLQKRDQKKTDQLLSDIHAVAPEQLMGVDKENRVFEFRELTDIAIEPASVWSGAKCGRVIFRDPRGKKRGFILEDVANAQAALQHLSEALGGQLKVNAVWDERKQKFVKKPA
jgi:hypothetical protein